MKNFKHQKDSDSYMQICFYQEVKGNVYIMVPTYYCEDKKEWTGFVKTPETQKMIIGIGKDSKDLEQSFIKEFTKFMESNPKEALSMFKPLEYWESRI